MSSIGAGTTEGKEAEKNADSGSELFHSAAALHIWLLFRQGLGCTHSSSASLMCEYSTHTQVHMNEHTQALSLSVNGHWTLSRPHGYTQASLPPGIRLQS